MMVGRFEEAIYLEELHFLYRREFREYSAKAVGLGTIGRSRETKSRDSIAA